MSGRQEFWGSLKTMSCNLSKYESSLGQRYYTLQLTFNLFQSLRGESIFQVGCQSRENQYASFDLVDIFAKLCMDIPNSTYDIYHDDTNLKRVAQIERIIYSDYNPNKIRLKNIINYDEYGTKYIDLLILNDICYPIHELTEHMSDSLNFLEARNILNGMSESELNKLYKDIIDPCRVKVLTEYETFKSRLSRSAIVLLEGNDYPGGSQTLLAKRQLESDGFICLLDSKQSIWIRR